MREQEVVSISSERKGFRVINKKFALLGFLVLSALLLFYAFAPESITGFAIGGPEKNSDKESDEPPVPSISISADVGAIQSPIETKQNIQRISIEVTGSSSKFFVGADGVTDLSSVSKAKIVMDDFSGYISFDGSSLLGLKGTVSKLSINGLPTAAADSEIKVRIEEPMMYEFLEIAGISLKRYEVEQETGKLSINEGKVSLEITAEPFYVGDFFGTLKSGVVAKQGLVRSGLSLSGSAKSIRVGETFQMSEK